MKSAEDRTEPSPRKKQGVGYRKGTKYTVKAWKGHPSYRWRVHYIEGGQHKGKGFKTKKEAESWAEKGESEALSQGTETPLTHAERAAVIDTRADLEKAGLSLREAVSLALRATHSLSPLGKSPDEALEFATDYFTKAAKSATVSEAVADLIMSRERAQRSKRYLQDLSHRLHRFQESFGDRAIATIESREIADWLHGLGLSPTSTNNFRRNINILFRQAKRAGFIQENPVAITTKVKEVEGEISIFTPEEITSLLVGAPKEIRASIAIGAFAGARASEIEQLDWSDVDLQEGFIRIRAKIAKSARNRLVPISANLNSWLQPSAKINGPVTPPDFRNRMDKARIAAGFRPGRIKPSKLKPEQIESLKLWPKNGLRHSYGSYHLAHHQDAASLALNMGHEDTSLIFRHYRQVVTSKEAATWWSIETSTAQNIIRMTV